MQNAVNYNALYAVYVQFLNAQYFHIFLQIEILQIEIGRQRDPKENWREEIHRNFYTHRGF